MFILWPFTEFADPCIRPFFQLKENTGIFFALFPCS